MYYLSRRVRWAPSTKTYLIQPRAEHRFKEMTMKESTNTMEQKLENFQNAKKATLHEANDITNILEKHSQRSDNTLVLNSVINTIKEQRKRLEKEVFEVICIGDLKRGKSTLLNAFLGGDTLPTNVTPCTALLTQITAGEESSVIIHYKDGTSKKITIDEFRTEFTIPADRQRELEEAGKDAFPNVSHATMIIPSNSILDRGTVIIDSPGLNDTAKLDEITLEALRSSHGAIMVLSASNNLTMRERRYLENVIIPNQIPTFFVINGMDEIKNRLLDSNPDTLKEAKKKLIENFRISLEPYIKRLNNGKFDKDRLFALSGLEALRCQLENRSIEEDVPEFARFCNVLSSYLAEQRGAELLSRLRIASRNISRSITEQIDTQILLLDEPIDSVEDKIRGVEPEFEQLQSVKDSFVAAVFEEKKRVINDVSVDFSNYLTKMLDTFEEDFNAYQPDTSWLNFLRPKKRQEFTDGMQQGFKDYFNYKITNYRPQLERKVRDGFSSLEKQAERYAKEYTDLIQSIQDKLSEDRHVDPSRHTPEHAPVWQRILGSVASIAAGDYAGVLFSATGGFNFRRIILNLIEVLAGTITLSVIVTILTGPIAAMTMVIIGIITSFGVNIRAARKIKHETTKRIKESLAEQLPNITRNMVAEVENEIMNAFAEFERVVVHEIDNDIRERKKVLNNLLAQKRNHEINRNDTLERYSILRNQVTSKTDRISEIYNDFLESFALA